MPRGGRGRRRGSGETDFGRPGLYFQLGGLVAIPTFEDDLDRELDAVLGPIFRPYGLFGVGAFSGEFADSVGLGVSVSETDLGLRAGGGFDVYVSPNVALNVEAAWVGGLRDLENLDCVAIGGGVVFRF